MGARVWFAWAIPVVEAPFRKMQTNLKNPPLDLSGLPSRNSSLNQVSNG